MIITVRLSKFIPSMTETNAITNNIIKYLEYKGHFASRIQSQGQYIAKIGRWVKSKVRRGIGDVIACIDGRFVMIEIKYGQDRQSTYQKDVEKDVKKAGGDYWIIKTFGEFLGRYESYNSYSHTQKDRDNYQIDQKHPGVSSFDKRNTSSKRSSRNKSVPANNKRIATYSKSRKQSFGIKVAKRSRSGKKNKS